MVVAEQMQQPMSQQERHLVHDRAPTGGLPARGLDRDDDIPEEVRVQARAFPFLHGECENIGRPILAAVLAVERTDGGIAAKEHRKLGLGSLDGRQHALGAAPHFGGGDAPAPQASGLDVGRHTGG